MLRSSSKPSPYDPKYFPSASLGFLTMDSVFRRLCLSIAVSKWFTRFVLLVIVVRLLLVQRNNVNSCFRYLIVLFHLFCLSQLNCINLVLNTMFAIESRAHAIIAVIDNVFLVIFFIEALLKMIAFGVFYATRHSYFRHRWNIFDFVIVTLGCVTLKHCFFPISA